MILKGWKINTAELDAIPLTSANFVGFVVVVLNVFPCEVPGQNDAYSQECNTSVKQRKLTSS